MDKIHSEKGSMSIKEIVIIAILTVLVAVLYITGLPSALFLNIEVLDITPFYWTLMLNFIIIGIIIFLTLKFLCPNWHLGMKKDGFLEGFKRFGIIGLAAAVISGIAFLVGIEFDKTPTVWKILIEGIIYYVGVAIVEELLVRGLFLNLIEKLLPNNKHRTAIAIIASSVVFGIGHIFGILDQHILVIIAKVIFTIGMGLFLGVIYKKSNNLWLPILIHFVIDICAIPYCFTTLQGYATVSLCILVPAYIILGIYSLYILFKKEKPLTDDEDCTKD